MRNERTSKRVAKIAGKVLAVRGMSKEDVYWGGGYFTGLKWSDIRALAASCLTQAADKKK